VKEEGGKWAFKEEGGEGEKDFGRMERRLKLQKFRSSLFRRLPSTSLAAPRQVVIFRC